jgi:NDP-sugar pyrophosphorylase family protein
VIASEGSNCDEFYRDCRIFPVKASDFFALPPSLALFAEHFLADAAPWEWVKQIEAALAAHPFPANRVDGPPGVHISGQVHLDASVELPPYAVIIGPAWIGAGTEIRPGAYIRGNVIAGANCVLGNSCEYKNSLLLEGVATPHYNYVGDSVLGNYAHLGAGVICSNLRLDRKAVLVNGPDQVYTTGMRKLGAIVGDRAEIGCNAVLNPGAVLGPRSFVAPALAFAGFLPPSTIAKANQAIKLIPRRD